MALILTDVGEEYFLGLCLNLGNCTLRLYRNDATVGLTYDQKEALVAADFTEANFTGYSAKTLTAGSWVITKDTPSYAIYPQQTFTRSATGTAQTIYGYTVHRASDNVLLWFEDFDGPLTVTANGDAIVVTPTITLDDDQEATVAARGIVALQTVTATVGPYSSDSTTSFVLNNVDVDATRTYRVGMNSVCGLTGASRWIIELWIDGVQSFRMEDRDTAGSLAFVMNFHTIWEPSTGTSDLEVKVNEISGAASIDFPADPTFPAQLWVEDIGVRLP